MNPERFTITCQIGEEQNELEVWFKPYPPEHPEAWMLTRGEKNLFVGYICKDETGKWKLFNSVAELSPEELQEIGKEIENITK